MGCGVRLSGDYGDSIGTQGIGPMDCSGLLFLYSSLLHTLDTLKASTFFFLNVQSSFPSLETLIVSTAAYIRGNGEHRSHRPQDGVRRVERQCHRRQWRISFASGHGDSQP